MCLQLKSFENKHCRIRKKFLQVSSNLILSSSNSFSLEGSKICRLGRGKINKGTIYTDSRSERVTNDFSRSLFSDENKSTATCITVICKNGSEKLHLTLSQKKPWFLHVYLLKTLWEKEKLLVMSNFSFSHSVFYPFGWTFCHFHQI